MVETNISQKKTFSPKISHNVTCQILMDWWKLTSTWCYHCSCKLIALELHNSCSYIVVTKLHELHMYIVSHMVNYICYNSCE
jgi:hypothetical protein